MSTHLVKNNTFYILDQLAKWLEWIVCKKKKRKLAIPTKPTANVPQPKKTGQVDTSTDEVTALHKQYIEGEGNFEKRANKMYRAWRMDINTNVLALSDNKSDREIGGESKSKPDSESETEMDNKIDDYALD